MADKRKKENILDMSQYIGKKLHVKFSGGREVEGTCQGTDALMNLVLDDTNEYIRDFDDPLKITANKRFLGLVICRGVTILSVCPADTLQEIDDPFTSNAVQ